MYRVERWNCRPRKDDIIPFPFNKNRFSFFVADHLLVGQLCTNPKNDRSLLSCLKVTQCSTSEIGDAPLYNSCSLPIQVMTARTIAGLTRITGTCPGWWKQCFRLRLRSLVWFQSFDHTSRTSPTWPPTTPKPDWSLPFTELPPVLVEKACSQFRIRIEAVIEADGSYIE